MPLLSALPAPVSKEIEVFRSQESISVDLHEREVVVLMYRFSLLWGLAWLCSLVQPGLTDHGQTEICRPCLVPVLGACCAKQGQGVSDQLDSG